MKLSLYMNWSSGYGFYNLYYNKIHFPKFKRNFFAQKKCTQWLLVIKEAQIYNIQRFSTLLNPFVESILPKSESHKPNVGYNAITQRWDKAGHNYS